MPNSEPLDDDGNFEPETTRLAGARSPLVGPQTFELYASGPGLMLHGVEAVADFVDGQSYTDALGSRFRAAGRRVRRAEIVMLDTGSPGLTYDLELHLGAPSAAQSDEALDAVGFHLLLASRGLIVRDGYQAETWGDDDYDVVTFDVPPGQYRVTLHRLPGTAHGRTTLRFHVMPGGEAPPQDWITLDVPAS